MLGSDPESSEDGLLQFRDIARLPRSADLVTLSACDTARGELQGEAGNTGLVQVFLFARAKSVVASVWSLDGSATEFLMRQFYLHSAGPVVGASGRAGAQPWEDCLGNLRKLVESAKQGRMADSPAQIPPLLALSNLGMFGVKEFSAIIPPACTAALAVGAARDVPLICDQRVQVGRVATLTLSADHRVVDGIIAAQFMQKMQEHLNRL